MMHQQSNENNDGIPRHRFVLVIAAIFLVWVLGGSLIYQLLPDWPVRGQFGDMFGAVNALFSGGALVGVVYAITLQLRELQLQRQELELTRQELARSATAQEGSAQGLLEQTRIQNSLLNAQLLRDRFESYWRTYEPVSDGQVAEFNLYPEDYMDRSLFEERYKGNETAIRRYIYMSLLYEYLGFTHRLPKLGVPDPLGTEWVSRWCARLVSNPEFRDVHQQYRGYTPEFERFIDTLIVERKGT